MAVAARQPRQAAGPATGCDAPPEPGGQGLVGAAALDSGCSGEIASLALFMLWLLACSPRHPKFRRLAGCRNPIGRVPSQSVPWPRRPGREVGSLHRNRVAPMDGLTAGAAYQAGSDALATLLRNPVDEEAGYDRPVMQARGAEDLVYERRRDALHCEPDRQPKALSRDTTLAAKG